MSLTRGNEIPTIDVKLVTITPKDSDKELGLDTASKIAVEPAMETTDAVKLIVKGVLRAQKPEEKTITGNSITLTDNVFNPELVKILQGGEIRYNEVYTITGQSKESGDYYFKLNDSRFVTFTLQGALIESDILVFDTYNNKVVKNRTLDITSVITTSIPGEEVTELTANDELTSQVIGYVPPVSGSTEKGETFTLNAYSAQYNAAGEIVRYEKIQYPNCTGSPVALSSEDGAFRAPEYTINSAPNKGQSPYEISYVSELPEVADVSKLNERG